MLRWRSVYTCARVLTATLALIAPASAAAATIYVPRGGDLQGAIDQARPGDTILLEPGATYVGNFRLPVHGGTSYVTIRSAASNDLLPGAGQRISPAYSPYLPKIKSPSTMYAMATAPGAGYWRLMFLEFEANVKGQGDILRLGETTEALLERLPHHIIVDRVYMHGDRLHGQKRGIGLNSIQTTIVNSYISEMKAVSQDSQAIGGWNGPGPYHIENNFLEAAAEVFLLGGEDPRIPGLVPSDVLFRGNTLTRPLSWRNPILPAPANLRPSAGTGGSLPAGTYAYRVTARRPAGTTTAKSPAAAEVSVTVAAGSSVTLQWDRVADATEYLVHGRTPGAQSMYWVVTSNSFTDTGAAGAAGTPSSSGTVWQVKNIFELKNARRVQIDYNLMENNWLQAQQGSAILLSPRNQYGTCTWCVVEDITIEYNVIRHAGMGVKISGYDDTYPSQQTNDVIIRNNEFSDISKAWGGTGYIFILLSGSRDLTIEHNTLISPSGSGILTVDNAPVYGFKFRNNVARHNTYGIQGAGKGYGNTAIAHYFPDGEVTHNAIAGGKASMYPAGNVFPALAEFESHFLDYPGSNFFLVPGTDWENAGTDGKDLGADMRALYTPQIVEDIDPPQVTTTALAPTTAGDAYSATIEAVGGLLPYRWSVMEGALPDGLVLDAQTGTVAGSATVAGDFTFTLRVVDDADASAFKPLSLRVERAIPPVEIVTALVADGVELAPYTQALSASGGSGTHTWVVSAGELPAGLALSADGVISGTPTLSGIAAFTVTAFDAADSARQASRSFSLVVGARVRLLPVVALTSPATPVVPVGSPVVLAAEAADSDGVVQRVEFHVNGSFAGAAEAAPFSSTWTAKEVGTFSVTATAVDNDLLAVTSEPLIITVEAPPVVEEPKPAGADIVLHAAQAAAIVGDFQLVADTTAAGGLRMWNPNRAVAKVSPSETPASYVEFTFEAEAGIPYQFWMRGLAERNNYSNDSVSVQFSSVADAEIGTTSAMSIILEDGAGAGVAGWGWQDRAYGSLAAPVVFAQGGRQTIRIQPREDGLSFDQVVLSPARYLTAAPGATRNDATILATTIDAVLYAADVAVMAGDFSLVADATAAGGQRLHNVNRVAPKVVVASAEPAHYAEFTFYAHAGQPYQLWMRMKAERNTYANDSVHVQFDAVSSALIGTTTSLNVNLEDFGGAGVAGWGWQDHGYGDGIIGAPVTFERSGMQRIRVQPREDGFSIDQIVLSPSRFLTASPGALKNDATIVAR